MTVDPPSLFLRLGLSPIFVLANILDQHRIKSYHSYLLSLHLFQGVGHHLLQDHDHNILYHLLLLLLSSNSYLAPFLDLRLGHVFDRHLQGI